MNSGTERIIGDFFEINSDNIYQRETSKLPKFISNLIAKNNYKKICKRIDVLEKSNFIFDAKNLAELFSYTYNGYPPHGNYNDIYCSKINDEAFSEFEAVVITDDIKAIITVTLSNELIELSIWDKSEDSYKRCSVVLEKLYSSKKSIEPFVTEVNKILLKTMCNFIRDNISRYYEKEK